MSFRLEGQNLVCYEIAGDFSNRRPAVELEATPEVRIAVERLKAEGLRSDAAVDLVHRHGPERCLRYAEAVTFRKNVRNRAGWVRKAIENGYELDVPDAVSGGISDGVPGTDPDDDASAPEDAPSPADPQMTLAVGPDDTDGYRDEAPGREDVAPVRLRPDPAAEEVWERVVIDLEDGIDVSSLRVWFTDTFGADLEGRALTVAVPNPFAKEYIESRFAGVLEETLADHLGEGAGLEVVVGERADEPAGQPA